MTIAVGDVVSIDGLAQAPNMVVTKIEPGPEPVATCIWWDFQQHIFITELETRLLSANAPAV